MGLLVQAAQAAGKWLIEKFLVHGLVAAVALPMTLMSVSSLIDSQWTVVGAPAAPSLTYLEAWPCVSQSLHLDCYGAHLSSFLHAESLTLFKDICLRGVGEGSQTQAILLGQQAVLLGSRGALQIADASRLGMQVMNRAVLAGQLLAHVLMSGAHGGRPVTLIGFSMGAR